MRTVFNSKNIIVLSIVAAFAMLFSTGARADAPGKHPAYLHALTDLRDARRHLEHHERGKGEVKWDEKKVEDKMRRIQALARESAELAFRMRIPTVEFRSNLDEVLTKESGIVALSEQESVTATIKAEEGNVCLVVGPEGGWAPREVESMKPYAVTLGPRVLRTEHAGFAAIAKLLVP